MPRKRDPNFAVVKVNVQLSAGALANDTAVKTALTNIADNATVIAADLSAGLRGNTAGEGPWEFGISKEIYSVAEIVEALDASPVRRDDEIALERTRRRVRLMGLFSGAAEPEKINNGLPVRARKLFWEVSANGGGIDLWLLNRSGATFTTGASLEVSGKLYIRWT